MKTTKLILPLILLTALTSACQQDPLPQVQALTVTEFLSEPESDSQVYELVGTVKKITNTTYGYLNINDGTATVYVNGLTATDLGYGAENDESFGSLKLNTGDRIRIRGYRGSQNGKAQVWYAWFVKRITEAKPSETPSETPSASYGSGTLADPYTPEGAIAAVSKLTWTSSDNYQKTGNVYVKGIISRISDLGTFFESGTYSNASFYISKDGKQNNEFYVFRILYFNKGPYTDGIDIKVGDEVVIYGRLMNYRGDFPETVSGECQIYSINGATSGGGTPVGKKISFETNSDAETWIASVDGTYGSGYRCNKEGLEVGYYKHTCSTEMLAPNANHFRIYWKGVLCIKSESGKNIKKIVIGCAPDAGLSKYCYDMTGLEGGAKAISDHSALTVTWTGSATKVVLQASDGQVRVEKLTVEFE